MTIIFFVQEKVCKHTVTYLYPEVSERTCTGSWRMSDGIHCCRWWYTWRCHHANHSTQKRTHLQIHTLISKANWIFFVVIFLRHDLKKINTYQSKTIIRALFSFWSRFVMWKRTDIRPAYLSLFVSRDPPAWHEAMLGLKLMIWH